LSTRRTWRRVSRLFRRAPYVPAWVREKDLALLLFPRRLSLLSVLFPVSKALRYLQPGYPRRVRTSSITVRHLSRSLEALNDPRVEFMTRFLSFHRELLLSVNQSIART
jgi:hypothetical protein